MNITPHHNFPHQPWQDNMYEGHLIRLYKQVMKLKEERDKGPILEFGVSQGTSIAVIAEACKEFRMPNRIVGFDSFQGLPEQEGIWHKGQFACSLEHVKENLAPWPNIELVPGWFDQVLTENLRKSFEPVSLVHIDCDIYSATVTVLKWIRKLIKSRTIFVFDEWPISEGCAWMQIMKDVEVEEIITSQQRIHRIVRMPGCDR